MGERNVFEHPEENAKLNANFPYITHIISEIKCLKGGPFLPAEVSEVFLSMISLHEDFNAISYERAVKRTKPKSNYKPCAAECYPNNPEHTMENQYEADTKRDKTEDKKCEKSYNSKATITGGFCVYYKRHFWSCISGKILNEEFHLDFFQKSTNLGSPLIDFW